MKFTHIKQSPNYNYFTVHINASQINKLKLKCWQLPCKEALQQVRESSIDLSRTLCHLDILSYGIAVSYRRLLTSQIL